MGQPHGIRYFNTFHSMQLTLNVMFQMFPHSFSNYFIRAKRISSKVPPAKSLSNLDGNLSHRPESITQNLASDDAIMNRSNDIRRATEAEGRCVVNSGSVTVPAVANSPCSEALREDKDFQGLCSALSSVSMPNHLGEGNTDSVIMCGSTYNHNPSMSENIQRVVNLVQIESSASSAPRESSNVKNLLGVDDQVLKGSGGTGTQ